MEWKSLSILAVICRLTVIAYGGPTKEHSSSSANGINSRKASIVMCHPEQTFFCINFTHYSPCVHIDLADLTNTSFRLSYGGEFYCGARRCCQLGAESPCTYRCQPQTIEFKNPEIAWKYSHLKKKKKRRSNVPLTSEEINRLNKIVSIKNFIIRQKDLEEWDDDYNDELDDTYKWKPSYRTFCPLRKTLIRHKETKICEERATSLILIPSTRSSVTESISATHPKIIITSTTGTLTTAANSTIIHTTSIHTATTPNATTLTRITATNSTAVHTTTTQTTTTPTTTTRTTTKPTTTIRTTKRTITTRKHTTTRLTTTTRTTARRTTARRTTARRTTSKHATTKKITKHTTKKPTKPKQTTTKRSSTTKRTRKTTRTTKKTQKTKKQQKIKVPNYLPANLKCTIRLLKRRHYIIGTCQDYLECVVKKRKNGKLQYLWEKRSCPQHQYFDMEHQLCMMIELVKCNVVNERDRPRWPELITE